MRKLALALLAFVMLAGCSVEKDLDTIVAQSLARPLPPGVNNSKKYLKYYLSPEFGVKASTPISSLLKVGDAEVMMSLDVSEIVANRYYNEQYVPNAGQASENRVYKEGVYLDADNVEHNFLITLIDLENSKAILVENGLVDLTAIVNDLNMEYVLDAMLVLMRSVELDEDLIVASYSNKEIIDYKPIHEEFFEQTVSESGSLVDMYNHMNPDDLIE